VVKGEARQIAGRLIEEGMCVPEVAEASGVKANPLHRAIRAGRLPDDFKPYLVGKLEALGHTVTLAPAA